MPRRSVERKGKSDINQNLKKSKLEEKTSQKVLNIKTVETKNIQITKTEKDLFEINKFIEIKNITQNLVFNEHSLFVLNNKFKSKSATREMSKLCHYCAKEHLNEVCKKIICKKCGKKGHLWNKCPNKHSKNIILCKKCEYSTHAEIDCPAVYRNYKLHGCIDTTNFVKSCGLCGGEHFSDDCMVSLNTNRFSVFNTKYIDFINKQFKK